MDLINQHDGEKNQGPLDSQNFLVLNICDGQIDEYKDAGSADNDI